MTSSLWGLTMCLFCGYLSMCFLCSWSLSSMYMFYILFFMLGMLTFTKEREIVFKCILSYVCVCMHLLTNKISFKVSRSLFHIHILFVQNERWRCRMCWKHMDSTPFQEGTFLKSIFQSCCHFYFISSK